MRERERDRVYEEKGNKLHKEKRERKGREKERDSK